MVTPTARHPTWELPIYSARPGVDVEVECVGEAMRTAIWELFQGDCYDTPDDIIYIFDSLLTDIALDHGWWKDADGRWYRPVLYEVSA